MLFAYAHERFPLPGQAGFSLGALLTPPANKEDEGGVGGSCCKGGRAGGKAQPGYLEGQRGSAAAGAATCLFSAVSIPRPRHHVDKVAGCRPG